ncbi:hypothetical protein L1049_019495 [Liquidambar formosana]|uniref:Uncharacterized protein n=1 Tax=Liquidambar formosana TaxID=63359 RepID=A0AAP0X6J4_LIQFO
MWPRRNKGQIDLFTHKDVERFKLGHPSSFHYLNQSECYELDGVDDSEEYLATRRAMAAVGISSKEQDAIFRVVAAILHLGNIEFANGEEIDSSQVKDKKSRFHLRTAAELFWCDAKALEDSLCKHVIVTPNEPITKWLDPHSAVVSRDTLAKIVYSRLFDWLVNRINSSLGQDCDSKFLIGVLDIYGFESLKTNSFEQFCINFTNEKLQQHFNQHVLIMEQEEYTKEEINWSYIDFVDNQDVLDLIEKVTYQTELFLDKNKDYVVAEHQALLNASKCSFVSGLFPSLSEGSSKASKFSSIGSRFKQQLQAFLDTLSATEPHYIRCVKPNNNLKPVSFDSKNVLQQLRCGGIMEAIRISCAAYPTRKQFYELVDRFGILAPEVLDKSYDEVTACKKLLQKVGFNGYQVGKTKVFLRAGQMAELDARRNKVLQRSASRIRSYLVRRSFILLCQSAIQIQALCRGQLARQVYESMRREASCLRIQRDLHLFLARKAYKKLCHSAVCIQTGMRGMAAGNEHRHRRQMRAAAIIQGQCRQYLARLHYMKIKEAAITTQCMWRGRVARRELRKLKMDAREIGALQAAKNKLEKQVEELTWRLQLEKLMRADMEEAKTQENAKLKFSLQEMQLQFDETKAMLMKEREFSKGTAEPFPIVKVVPVIEHAMLEKLTAENEKLKALVSSLEKKIDETEKKYEETNKSREESVKQALEAESKIVQLKTAMHSLEEKISDMESKNQILRQRPLLNSPVEQNTEHPSTMETREPESATPFKNFETESDSNLRISHIERQHENVGTLINCVMKKIGFSNGKPIAAFTIYKCLLHGKSFKAERAGVFDCLIEMIRSEIKNEDNDHQAYWLSNISMLLFLLQRSLEASGGTGATPHQKPSDPTSLYRIMTMGFCSSPSSANLAAAGVDVVHKFEANDPTSLFKQQLTVCVEIMCGIIRENLKEELSPLLSLCFQAPRTSKGSVYRSGRSFGKDSLDSPSSHWQSIIECLNASLSTMKQNFVPPILVQKIFTQVFSYINMQLFNSLLDYECCTFSDGDVNAGLAELEHWCCQAEDYAGSCWDKLKHIRQAVRFLVIQQKCDISYDEITHDLCPILSFEQLYRICPPYWDGIHNTQSPSPDVISRIRTLKTEDSNNAAASSFLLDDSSSIPFSVVDLFNSLQGKDFLDVKSAEELLKNPAFKFLYE